MASTFWYQITGGEDAWLEAMSEHRQKILRERRPAFMTVLDAHSSPDASWDREEYAKMKYSGPLYFDFDAEDISETIPQFKKFLENLKDMQVNLHSLRLYATGGRGFHIEIPEPVFMSKVPKTGITALPYIYREMAMSMVVDTLDLRVYTGRRGRMWRTMGVERSKGGVPSGKYKVPISVDEALGMTPELYDEVCSHCATDEPTRGLPELSPGLEALFVNSQAKVEKAFKGRAKSGADAALLARFKGQFPPTVEMIMRGENVVPGLGFQKLAMQLAIAANALGKTSDQLVEAATGLCKTHEGNSDRYGSPRKRKEELRRMWDYTHDNPCYSYSKGGIRSLVMPDVPTGDLDGLTSTAGVGSVSEEDDEEMTPELASEITSAGASLLEGLMITRTGVHKRTAEGAKTISNIGFQKTSLLRDVDDLSVIGYEAELLCDGKSVGCRTMTQKDFMSRASLSAMCATYGGVFSGSDTQAGVVSLLLRRSAEKKGRVVYAVHKEGLDIVQSPVVTDRVQKDTIWVHENGVVTDNAEAGYVYRSSYGSSAAFKADVHMSPPLVNTPDTLAWMRHLLKINNPTVVAQVLGWFVSCFHKQHYHQAFNQFPLLHPNGPAGSGKTQTTLLLSRLNYFTTDPVMRSAGTQTKEFALKVLMSSSASVPLILDEYKPSEMGHIRTDFLLQSFRLAYNQGFGASGGIARGSASSSFRDVTEFSFSTPIAFLAEAQEMQTAIIQRSLPIYFDQAEAKAHTPHFDAASAGQHNLSALGRTLLKYAYRETVDSRRAALEPIRDDLRKAFQNGIHDRQVYNLAIVLAGLNFLDDVLGTVFGGALRDDMAVLKQAVYDQKADLTSVAMSEPAKVLGDISMITRTEDSESEFSICEGREYVVLQGHVEILMRETFVKYFSWCKRKGFTPYYASAEAFMVAMGKFPATVDKLCMGSPLRKNGQARIFRFNLEKLMLEGVEMFKTKA